MVMAAAEEIVLEIVREEAVLRLRAGQKIIAFTALEDSSLAKLSHVGRSYARRNKMRFVDVARN
jgi:D-arabinose 5-phosphate isomerase GutQ